MSFKIDIAQEFSEQTSEMIFTDHFEENHMTYIVYRDRKGTVFLETLRNLIQKKALISQFSPMNAYLLGYLAACEMTK